MDSEKKYDEDGHIIVAENVQVQFSGSLNLMETLDGDEEEKEEEEKQ